MKATRTLLLACAFVLTFCISSFAATEKGLPSQVLLAKSIYLDNETGDQGLLDAASEQFTKWGRFTIAKTKEDADLTAVFTHRNGMDKLGNVGITEMDVFLKGALQPSFQVQKGGKTIFDPHGRIKSAMNDFRKLMEAKN